jgi:hypothetical protein
LKDISNNITIDLSAYVFKTNFDLSFNNLSSNFLELSGGTLSNDLIINNGYTSNERIYPSKLYDSFIPETTNSGEISNIYPSTYIKEVITLTSDNMEQVSI